MNAFVWIYKLHFFNLIFLSPDELCPPFFPFFWRIWAESMLLLFVDGWVFTGVLVIHVLIAGFGNSTGHKFWKGPNKFRKFITDTLLIFINLLFTPRLECKLLENWDLTWVTVVYLNEFIDSHISKDLWGCDLRITYIVMVNFMVSRQLIKHYSKCAVRGLLDEINNWMSRLSKVDSPP